MGVDNIDKFPPVFLQNTLLLFHCRLSIFYYTSIFVQFNELTVYSQYVDKYIHQKMTISFCSFSG